MSGKRDETNGGSDATGRLSILFVSSVVYDRPLDPTSAKKFQALGALGDVAVLGFARGLRPESFTEGARFCLLPSVAIPVLRYLLLCSVGALVLTKWLRRAEASVLVAQSPYEGFAAALAKKLARFFGKKVALVVESHGDFEVAPFLQRPTPFAGLYRFGILRLSRYALRHADALRAVSAATSAQLLVWAPDKPLVTFPAWTDIEAFLEAGVDGAKDEKLLLFAGVVAPTKGVAILVEAFHRVIERHSGARLEIVGRVGNPEYAATLSARVGELGLDTVVTFHPSVPQTELARKMARATALVLPSISEGLGRVAFEAMASGTPVIGSDVGGIVDLIADGETGLLARPGDVDQLAEKIGWVLAHPERAREMGQAARLFAREFFSTERYLAGYREVLSLARHGTGK